MQTISILGCGWLGLPLGAFLVEKGYTVKGSTTRTERLPLIKKAGIEAFLLQVDEQIRPATDAKAFFNADILILNIPPRRRTPNIETRYPKQIQLIVEAARAGNIKNLVFVSSTGVYGNVNRMVTEAETPVPERASGKALLQCEQFLSNQAHISSTILRLSGLVGGERKAGRFLAGKKDLDNAKAPINLIHRADCIQIIYQIIKQAKWGSIYNASADEHPEKAAFYKYQTQKMGLEAPTFLEGTETSFKIISNQKLKQELNYQFIHPNPMQFPQ